jgi:hypothetical protein
VSYEEEVPRRRTEESGWDSNLGGTAPLRSFFWGYVACSSSVEPAIKKEKEKRRKKKKRAGFG